MWHENIDLRGGCSEYMVKTQDDTIQKQFYVGNRGFDIRTYVENGNRNGKTHQIGIAHGNLPTWGESKIQLAEAFEQFDQLLNDNPNEFLFFRISIERDISKDNTDAYVTQANNIINKYPNRFVTYRPGLTVGDVRGKFLVGYKGGKGSFDQKGAVDPFNKLGSISQYYPVRFSNDFSYKHDSEELMSRFDYIQNHRPAFIECNKPYDGHTPEFYANHVNPIVENKLLHINYAGMVSHDFSNHYWYVPNRIVNLNSK